LNSLLGNITQLAQFLIQERIKPGDFVIDGTAGNGHDTLFLAKLVSDNGKVYSFDIQSQAIEYTKEKLLKESLFNRVELIMSSHECIKKYVKNKIKVAMFNLGYLPGGNHSITTKGNSTILALEQVLELLLPGGIISICLYCGHSEGIKELELVNSFLDTLNNKDYNVVKLNYVNKKNDPPKLVLIEKN
jgi:predicted methyltransferase